MRDGPAFAAVAVGDALPALVVPVTAKSVVTGAMATRDFHPVHHDVDAARAQGAANIFMNILTSNGLAERFVAEWAGPGATILSIAIRLGLPNYPGDVMTITGGVIAKAEAGACWIDVSLSGRNDRGEHLGGTIRVELSR